MSVKKQKDRADVTVSRNSDTPQDSRKRKTVGKVVATAGLVTSMSGNWKKPILSSVVLPAHAITTCGDDGDCSSDGTVIDGIVG